jgi:class 3 adenylate cyclase
VSPETDKPQDPKFRPNRTFICSVVFIDIVAYSKKPVDDQMRLKEQFNAILAGAIRDVAVQDRIVLDTGDGAAISFLSDPEEALIAAMGIQGSIRSLPRDNVPLLAVRIGINLGPVKLIKDINDNPNLVGDGINVAQRIMSFASPGELLVSRSYYDVISCLSEDYARLFEYRGARADKHIREHDIYEVTSPVGKALPVTDPEVKEEETPQKAVESKSGEELEEPSAESISRQRKAPSGSPQRKILIGIGGALLAVTLVVILLLVPAGKKTFQTGKTADAPKAAMESSSAASARTAGKAGVGKTEEALDFRAQSMKADEIVFTLSEASVAGKQVVLVVRVRNQSRAAKSVALYDSAFRWTKSTITDQIGKTTEVASVASFSGGKKKTMAQAGTTGLPVAAGSAVSITMVFPAPSGSTRTLKAFHFHPFIYQGRSWKEHSLTFRNIALHS